MKKISPHSSIACCLIVFVLLCLGVSPRATAGDVTWTGGAGSNWATPANWSGGAVPVATDGLVFAGSTDLSNSNNLTAGTQFNGLTFASGAGAFVLSGTDLSLAGNILNSSANLQTVSLNMALLQTSAVNSGAVGITIGGTVSGGFGLTKQGAGVLTLNAANSYTGTSTVSSGTLTLAGASGAIASSSAIRVISGAGLTLNNANNNNNRIGNSSSVSLAGGTFSFLGNSAATSYSESAGQLRLLAGPSTLTTSVAVGGQTSILTFDSLSRDTGAFLRMTTNTNLGNTRNRVLFSTAPTPINGILPYVIVSTTFGTYDATNGVQAFVHTGSNQAQNLWVSTDNVLLNNSGTGAEAVTLTGNRDINSLVIAATGSSATINLGSNRLAVNSGGIISRNLGVGGRFVSGGTLTAGSFNVGGELNVTSLSTSSGSALTIGSEIADYGSGAVAFSWNNQGNVNASLSLTGSNTYSGGTWLNGGNVRFTSDASFGAVSGTVTIGSNTTLLWDGAGVGSAFTLNSGRVIQINEGVAATFQTNAANSATNVLTIAGSITGQGSLLKQVSAALPILLLTGTNTYTGGTLVNIGVLEVRNGSALSNVGAVSMSPGSGTSAILRVTDSEAIGSLASAGSGTSTVQIANAQTLTIGGDNTSTTFNGVITGTGGGFTGAVTKNGTGVLTLTNSNLYTGATTVNAGTLLINGSGTGSSHIVNASGILGGSGTTGGITLNVDGGIAPGNSIGTLSTNNGNLVWNGQASGTFGQMKFELNNLNNSSDLLSLGSGLFDKGTGIVFSFDFLGTGGDGFTYTLVNFGSTDFSVGDFSYTNLASGLSGSFVQNANNLQFVTSAIPEPSTVALAGIGLAFVLWRRRSVSLS